MKVPINSAVKIIINTKGKEAEKVTERILGVDKETKEAEERGENPTIEIGGTIYEIITE